MLAMPKEKPRSESTTWRSWTATSVVASSDSSLAWAELHQKELEENWRRARAGETLLDIEPLK